MSEITICDDEARWPLTLTGTLSEGRPPTYPLTLDPQEALEVWDDLENQIRHRDLTMVEQAQCVAGYRITMGGRLSTGMYSELMYASHTAEPARPVLMYADASDHGLEHPFLRNFNHRTFYSIEDWFDAISRIGPSASPEAQQPLFLTGAPQSNTKPTSAGITLGPLLAKPHPANPAKSYLDLPTKPRPVHPELVEGSS